MLHERGVLCAMKRYEDEGDDDAVLLDTQLPLGDPRLYRTSTTSPPFVDSVMTPLNEVHDIGPLALIHGHEPGPIVAAQHGPPVGLRLCEDANNIVSPLAPLLGYPR